MYKYFRFFKVQQKFLATLAKDNIFAKEIHQFVNKYHEKCSEHVMHHHCAKNVNASRAFPLFPF